MVHCSVKSQTAALCIQIFYLSFFFFYCSSPCAIHIGSPSGDHTEMEIELANTFSQSVECQLNQILNSFFHSVIKTVEQFSVSVITLGYSCIFVFFLIHSVWHQSDV